MPLKGRVMNAGRFYDESRRSPTVVVHPTRRVLLQKAAAEGMGLTLVKGSRSAWAFQANGRVNVALVGKPIEYDLAAEQRQ
jgi:hypothetical protein